MACILIYCMVRLLVCKAYGPLTERFPFTERIDKEFLPVRGNYSLPIDEYMASHRLHFLGYLHYA